MRTGLASFAAVILVLLGLVLLILMLNVTGLPLCADGHALRDADECIDATSGERVLGLVAGWLAVVCAVLAVACAVRFAIRGAGAGPLALTAALTPVLGLLAVAFLPVSF
ncbi:MAG TPA: hypothetical protein VFY99_09705 [Solirubrobacterales bacterium]